MMTLEEMKAVDIRTVDPETLVDIRDVPTGLRMVILPESCTGKLYNISPTSRMVNS